MRECLSIHIGQAGVQCGNVSFFTILFFATNHFLLPEPNISSILIILPLFFIDKINLFIPGMLGTLLLGTRHPT